MFRVNIFTKAQTAKTALYCFITLSTIGGAANAFSVPLLTPFVATYTALNDGPNQIPGPTTVSYSGGTTEQPLLCYNATPTATACASARAAVNSWGVMTSMAESDHSSIPNGFWGSYSAAESLDWLVVLGLAPGTYSLVPTVQLHGEVSGVNQSALNSVSLGFFLYAADGTTELFNGVYSFETGAVDITQQLFGLEFQASEAFNFRLGFGQNANIFDFATLNTMIIADFLSTMTVTGFEILDEAGQSVSGWEIVSESGARYTANGISVVPEPITLALFGIGLAGLGWSRRKKV